MMLMQSSLPSSFDAGVSSVSDHGPQEFLCFWIPGDGTWQELDECDIHPQHGHSKAVPATEDKNKDDNSCSQNFLSSSPLSTKINMSEASKPTFVYKRRKVQRNSAAVLPLSQIRTPTFVYKRKKGKRSLPTDFSAQVSINTRASGNCFSASSSEAASIASKEKMISVVHNDSGALTVPDLHPVENDKLDLASKSGSVDGASLGCEPAIKEDPKSKLRKALDFCAINDSCSSSKSNMDLGYASLKPHVDDVGDCSSSGGLIMDRLEKDISGKNLFISLLSNHGVLERSLPTKTHRSAAKRNMCCLRLCKVCDQSETTLKMLICDQCEEAFHVSCCNPSIKKVPVDEWFCHSCLRKKLKKLKEKNSSKLPKDDFGPIESMLRDIEPYTTKVRIGKDFQAEVPDWSGPITDDLIDYGEPVEMSPLDCASYQEWNSSKLSRLSSIGNWLQCREVMDGVGEGVDGTICGKWRRAPLFEVQTDDWECFRCVLWDPTHADCAVPQELDTDQVLKHLKYIEMLRPRLAAKRCKLGVNKGVDSQEHTGDPRNTEAS